MLQMKNNELWEGPDEGAGFQPLGEVTPKAKFQYWAGEDIGIVIKEATIQGRNAQRLFGKSKVERYATATELSALILINNI